MQTSHASNSTFTARRSNIACPPSCNPDTGRCSCVTPGTVLPTNSPHRDLIVLLQSCWGQHTALLRAYANCEGSISLRTLLSASSSLERSTCTFKMRLLNVQTNTIILERGVIYISYLLNVQSQISDLKSPASFLYISYLGF